MGKRPEFVTNEHIVYLDALRESGIINMWSAPAYVQNHFNIDEITADAIFFYWKGTFNE